MRYQQESGGGCSSATSTPKPPGSVCSSVAAASVVPGVASEAALSVLGLDQLVPGASLASLLGVAVAGGASIGAPTAPITATGTNASADGSGSDDGLMPVPNLSNK
jgi:hypothetical protein